jgi:hypothetical protein
VPGTSTSPRRSAARRDLAAQVCEPQRRVDEGVPQRAGGDRPPSVVGR